MSAICVRLDDLTKTRLDEFCDSVGLTVSAIFTIFAKKVVREGRIPFEISSDPFYSESNQAHLKKAIEQFKNRQMTEHELIEA